LLVKLAEVCRVPQIPDLPLQPANLLFLADRDPFFIDNLSVPGAHNLLCIEVTPDPLVLCDCVFLGVFQQAREADVERLHLQAERDVLVFYLHLQMVKRLMGVDWAFWVRAARFSLAFWICRATWSILDINLGGEIVCPTDRFARGCFLLTLPIPAILFGLSK